MKRSSAAGAPAKILTASRSGWDGMIGDFSVELIAQDNDVFKLIGKSALIQVAVVPNLCFPQKVEARTLDHLCLSGYIVRSEEDRRPKDSLEGSNEAPVLLASLLQPEGLQHFGAALEANRLALLLHSESGQVDRHEPVLTKRETKLRVPGDLQKEIAVSSLEEHFALRWSANWQPAKHKGTGAESQTLVFLLTFNSDQATPLGLPEFLFGDDQLRSHLPENRAG